MAGIIQSIASSNSSQNLKFLSDPETVQAEAGMNYLLSSDLSTTTFILPTSASEGDLFTVISAYAAYFQIGTSGAYLTLNGGESIAVYYDGSSWTTVPIVWTAKPSIHGGQLSTDQASCFYEPGGGGALIRTDKLSAQVPISNGGTAASSVASARSNLGVPGLTGGNTITGAQSYTGQLELTGQAATYGTSAMTRDLVDARCAPIMTYQTTSFTAVAGRVYLSNGTNTVTLPAASTGVGLPIIFHIQSGTTTITGIGTYTNSRYPLIVVSNGVTWSLLGNAFYDNAAFYGTSNVAPNQTGSVAPATTGLVTDAQVSARSQMAVLTANSTTIVTNTQTAYQSVQCGVGTWIIDVYQAAGCSAYTTEGFSCTMALSGGTSTAINLGMDCASVTADFGAGNLTGYALYTQSTSAPFTQSLGQSGRTGWVKRRARLVVTAGTVTVTAQMGSTASSPSVGVTPLAGSYIIADLKTR